MRYSTTIKPSLKARIGLYSIGHSHYWSQFKGLRERLLDYGIFIEKRVAEWAKVYNFGMVDSAVKSRKAGEWFNEKNVDLLFCHTATYALSATHIQIPQICKRPLIILNLQPSVRMNYEKTTTGEWLAHCVAVCVPEIANACMRSGIQFHVVSGLLGLDKTPKVSITDEVTKDRPEAIQAWREIKNWVDAASVVRTLHYGRMGFLGHTYPGMLDMYSDFTMVQSQTGMYIEILEMCELARFIPEVTEAEKEQKSNELKDFFIISEDSPADPIAKKPTEEQLDWSCTVAVAQEKLVREYDLDALTYYYRGWENNEYQRLQEAFILGHSLLTGRGIPCSGEGDVKTAVAMKICDILGVGGSYCEIVGTDFIDNTIIMGHDGPFHIAIAQGKPVLRGMGLYHGKWGTGVSVEAKVRSGPVTILGITQTYEGKIKMIINQGTAIDGPILKVGNTMTPVKFTKPPSPLMNDWFSRGPTHHFAMSVGSNTDVFQRVALLLRVPCEIICY